MTLGLARARRILVLGSGGAGKSTFARALGDRLALPVVHLDLHFWSFGWKATPEAEWNERVRRLAAADAWVMDGNFSGSLPLRIPRSEAIVLLDLPRLVCLRSVLARWWKYRLEARPDLPEGCPEKIDLAFLRWVWNFPERSRPRVLAALEQATGAGVEIVRIRARRQVQPLLTSLPARPRSSAGHAPVEEGSIPHVHRDSSSAPG